MLLNDINYCIINKHYKTSTHLRDIYFFFMLRGFSVMKFFDNCSLRIAYFYVISFLTTPLKNIYAYR